VVHPLRPVHGLLGRQLLDDFSPLREPLPNIPIPAIQGIPAQIIGEGLAAVTGVASPLTSSARSQQVACSRRLGTGRRRKACREEGGDAS